MPVLSSGGGVCIMLVWSVFALASHVGCVRLPDDLVLFNVPYVLPCPLQQDQWNLFSEPWCVYA